MTESRVSRRTFFLGAGAAGLAAGLLPHSELTARGTRRSAVAPFPRNDLERVQSVVGASHGNLEVVRELVTEQPALAKASWDWGFGDWESALGAAAHTGRREIAEFLLAHGARPNLFSAAMMGEVDVVRGHLEAAPDFFLLRGPHGIPLMAHARAGGEAAESVLDYLLEHFGDDTRPFGTPGTEAVERRYAGSYLFELGEPVEFAVAVRGMSDQWLTVGVGTPNSRVLEVEPDVFYPSGAPAVRLHFQVEGDQAQALTIHDGPMVATGRRVER